MGAVRPVLTPRALTRRVSTAKLRWPRDSDTLRVELDESSFTSGAFIVTVEATWDGVTFPWVDPTGPFDPGVFIGEDGLVQPRSITLGPFMVGDPDNPAQPIVRNPIGVRVHIEPVSGSPHAGLRCNAED